MFLIGTYNYIQCIIINGGCELSGLCVVVRLNIKDDLTKLLCRWYVLMVWWSINHTIRPKSGPYSSRRSLQPTQIIYSRTTQTNSGASVFVCIVSPIEWSRRINLSPSSISILAGIQPSIRNSNTQRRDRSARPFWRLSHKEERRRETKKTTYLQSLPVYDTQKIFAQGGSQRQIAL